MFKNLFKNKEIEIALEAVKNNPDNILKLNILANLYFKNNFFNEAIEVYEKILRLDENYLPALSSLGKCYILNKQYLKGFRTLKFLHSKSPEDTQAKTLLISLKDADCDNEAKVEILKGLCEIDNSISLKENLAKEFLKSGQFTKSATIFENLCSIEEKGEYLIALGKIYQSLNKFDKAANSFEKLMLTNDFKPEHAQNLAKIYVSLKRFEEAKGLYELLITNIPSKTNYFKEQIAEILLLEKNPDEVIEVTNNVISTNKYSVESKFLQAQALFEKQNFEEALEFLREFYYDPINKETEKRIEEKIIEVSVAYAQNLRTERKFVEAIDILTMALRYDEMNKAVYLELANISNDIKDYSAAKEYIKIANEL